MNVSAEHPIAGVTTERPRLFLSASVPDDTKEYAGCERHRETARPQWIRDAVLALARAAFTRGFDIVSGAHPSISPMLLSVASEFPVLTPPRVAVFQSDFFLGRFPRETLELTDPSLGLGQLVAIPRASDQAASLASLRQAMFERRGLCAAIFVGGMNGLVDEAALFKRHNPTLPTYSVASTGGAALDLLDQPLQALLPTTLGLGAYTPADFCGAPLAPIGEAVLRARQVGYTRVARTILTVLEAQLAAGVVRSRS
jgi:hypothetical protein